MIKKPTCPYTHGMYSKIENVVIHQIILQINVISSLLMNGEAYVAMRINTRRTIPPLGEKE